MSVTNGGGASEGAGGGGYVLSIYPRLQRDTAACCTLVVSRDATATSVVQEAGATLGLGGAEPGGGGAGWGRSRAGAEPGGALLYQLVEVREPSGAESVLEGGDRPVDRVLLWPPHARDQHPQSEGYYFHLQERGDGHPGDGHPGDPSDGHPGDGDPPELEVGDLCHLPLLTEAGILAHLVARFHANKIYTYAGGILLALNPFRFLPVYNPKYVKLYDGHAPGRLEPHVFAVADRAFCGMLRRRGSQCIVITGESGSGKTQNANFLLHCLTTLRRKGYSYGVERTVLGAGPVLEAFGNAKTVHNDNSSRFGKFIQVNYLESGVVRGAVVKTYLLEKSRVVSREPSERNFHVFYYLLAGASEEERLELKLLQPDDYFYLTQQGFPVEEKDGLCHEFKRLHQAMEMIGFLPATKKQIFSVLSAVLHLGNLTFTCRETPMGQRLEAGPPETLNTLSHLLQVKKEMLVEALTKRKTLVADGTLSSPYSQSEALTVRDSLAKALYSSLFHWIVLRINHSLLNKKDIEDTVLPQQPPLSIGVLDMFGFEDCRNNSFDQFCINYANEHMQYYFNQHNFKQKQEEYEAEGLTWENINYRDNSGIIHLISTQPSGLLPLLDQESNNPHGTDQTLLANFQLQHHESSFFSAAPEVEPTFTIHHFARKVKYQAQYLRVKNRDHVHAGVLAVLRRSDRSFVRGLMGMNPAAIFRWGVIRAAVHLTAAFKQAARCRAAKNAGLLKRGSRTSIGNLRRKSSTTVERIQSRSSLLEFSFDRSEESPLEILEDIFASYEKRKRSRGSRQKQLIPKSLINARSLSYIVGVTLHDLTTTSRLHLHYKKTPSISTQFQVSLYNLLKTLEEAEPFFIQCICSNAEKKEMCVDEALVLEQLQYSGLLETVKIQREGYSAKYTFQEFTETFGELLPKDAAEPQRDIPVLLQNIGLDPSTYQIHLPDRLQPIPTYDLPCVPEGATAAAAAGEAAGPAEPAGDAQDSAGAALVPSILSVPVPGQSPKHFLRMRAAAIVIQRWWRGVQEESHHRAAAMIQALWRGSHQRAEYLKQRASIVKMQALVRASSARRRCRSLENELGGVPGGGQAETGEAGKGGAVRYDKRTATREKAERWKDRRSEGAYLDTSQQLLNLKDRRARVLMPQGLSLSLDNVSKLSSSESDSPVQVRFRQRRRRKRRLAHARSGLMLQSRELEDEYWTFPLPPMSPAPPLQRAPHAPRAKPRVQFKSPTETIPEEPTVSCRRRKSSGSSPVTTPERYGSRPIRPRFREKGRDWFLSRFWTGAHRESAPEEPQSQLPPSEGQVRSRPLDPLQWAEPLQPLHSYQPRHARLHAVERLLEREITSGSELRHLDEFLGNQVNDLRSRVKNLSGTESIFLTATMAFRETIKGMYSLSKPQIRYKGLLKNYQDKVTSLAGQKQKSEVKLVVNLFQSVLDGFIRGELKRQEAEPAKPSKKQKKRWSKAKCESILDHMLSTYQVNIMQSCDQCGSYIWGMEKAFMCCSCKMVCHKKCLSRISTDCSTLCAQKYDGESDSLQFGVRVCLLISSSNPVPVVMEKLLGHLEMNGLYTEGIYRKSGSARCGRELHHLLDNDLQSVSLEEYPIHTIAGLVKKWLRELPDPLMTFTHYNDFLRAVELPEKKEKLRAVYKVLDQLPSANFNTLERLFFHLVIVAKEEAYNRMTPNSLAIVFAPCLLRSPDTSDPFMSMNDVGKTTMCVEMLINEQIKRYNEKMEEIEQLELAEALAINQLRLRRQNTVMEKEPPVPESGPPDSDTEEKSLMERDDLAYRLPELEQPGSDHDNLDSEASMSCESLQDAHFGNTYAEGKAEQSGSDSPGSSRAPHTAPETRQEPSGRRKDGVQSLYIAPSQDPIDCQPAQEASRPLSETDIPYIDEESEEGPCL
ncbi:hypothetical protein AAFF_G00266490 [Aldrovandia affinis]|uniref:Unconventional myosin-IXb n=1 Tax=Aldrovandia affinis TaxID=143900 RepID=A0AAD7W2I6_9TELE|nr:hypothetical protein AAFF_G00266490 [Aldrovandia affinis]